MTIFSDALRNVMELPGARHLCCAEKDTGVIIAERGTRVVDPEEVIAWAGSVGLLLARSPEADELDDVMITSGRYYHLLRQVEADGWPPILVYLCLDRARANLAVARRELAVLNLAPDGQRRPPTTGPGRVPVGAAGSERPGPAPAPSRPAPRAVPPARSNRQPPAMPPRAVPPPAVPPPRAGRGRPVPPPHVPAQVEAGKTAPGRRAPAAPASRPSTMSTGSLAPSPRAAPRPDARQASGPAPGAAPEPPATAGAEPARKSGTRKSGAEKSQGSGTQGSAARPSPEPSPRPTPSVRPGTASSSGSGGRRRPSPGPRNPPATASGQGEFDGGGRVDDPPAPIGRLPRRTPTLPPPPLPGPAEIATVVPGIGGGGWAHDVGTMRRLLGALRCLK